MKKKIMLLVGLVLLLVTSCASHRTCTGTVSKAVINKYKPVKNNFVKAKYHFN